MTEKIKLNERPNIDFFHYPGMIRKKKGEPLVDVHGRLAATVFSKEVVDGEYKGQIAVGISRARWDPKKPTSNENKLSRHRGRGIAEARLNNFVSLLNGDIPGPQEGETEIQKAARLKRLKDTENAVDQKLVCLLSKEDFETLVKTNPFIKPDCQFGFNARAVQSAKDKLVNDG